MAALSKSEAVGDVTLLLRRLKRGETASEEALFRLVEPELRERARAKLRHEPADPFLQTTILVHDAFLALVKTGRLLPRDRVEFLAWASRVMRNKLVSQGRYRRAAFRGGGKIPQPLEKCNDIPVPEPAAILQALDEALGKLASLRPELAQITQQHFFLGASFGSIAEKLGLREHEVKQKWRLARAFLRLELEKDDLRDS